MSYQRFNDLKKVEKSLLLILFTVVVSFAQQPVINELMPSNFSIISDEDGDNPDWIEIYNPGSNAVQLNNFGLSDDTTNQFKWIFPEVTLLPHKFLYLFASGKDRTVWADYWETIIDLGDVWKYQPGTSEPPVDWNMIPFNDSEWAAGPSGFGYGDGDDSTVVAPTISLYLRKKFLIDNANDVRQAILHVDYDDAFVAYLNGVEIARANIGSPGIPPLFNQVADSAHEAQMYQGGAPEMFVLNSPQSLLQAGENVLAIQVHNVGLTSSDLSLIPFLTLGMNQEPVNPTGINPILNFTIPKLHTNFKISSEGETLILSDSTGAIIDQISTGIIPTDISLGRQPDGTDFWYYFLQPTPGDSNNSASFTGFAPEPEFSLTGGFYFNILNVSLITNSTGAVIRFTTDGSEPSENSALYTTPVNIDSTTVVRARSFEPGSLPSQIVTHTFFINEPTTLPVVSLSTDPDNFWSEQTGIYVLGPNASPDFPYFGANFWEDWERPVHIEFFEPNGALGFSVDCGVKIFGGWSRGFPQKSLALYARDEYGASEFNYHIFSNKPLNSFESIILRNSGNDWNVTQFRDALISGLADKSGVDFQAYRPAVVYINGEYWGVHNIREKINEHFLASNHEVNPENIDLLENDGSLILGDASQYHQLIDFLSSHNLAVPANYDQVKSYMDIDNFINYQVTEIFCDNTDWPGNNLKFWRSQTPGGVWRWILYDTDFGFGLFDEYGYSHNTLEFATEENGPAWPNPPWSTFILRKLLENQNFRYDFINRFADFLNTYFVSSRVLSQINELQYTLDAEMERHFNKWGGSAVEWSNNIQRLRTFASLRPAYVRLHVINKFGLSGASQLNLNLVPSQAGKIRVSTIIPDNYPWTGFYFQGIPIKVSASPSPGFRFSHWEGISPPDSATTTIVLQDNLYLTAVFEPDSNSSSIVINEINYNSAPDFDVEDWVEFYNNTGSDIDISGWVFKDSDDIHNFTFPAQTILAADEYLVLCRDTSAFSSFFPNVSNYMGNFDFALSNGGELIRLFDDQGFIIDSLTYDDVSPWPVEPDGSGPTLSLKNPGLDNSISVSWSASGNHGTPGTINDVFISVFENSKIFIPDKFQLFQNYPNPFNPQTTIQFDLPQAQHVILKIYDSLGRLVNTIVDKELNSGQYSFRWKPQHNIASGIYFYRIEYGNTIKQTKKMLLLK